MSPKLSGRGLSVAGARAPLVSADARRRGSRAVIVLCVALAVGLASLGAAAAAWALPDGRSYEMVSPVDKNGGDIDRDRIFGLRSQFGAAASGDAVAYGSRVQFGDLESAALEPTYAARRGPDGWVTEGITPPIGNVMPGASAEFPAVAGLSPDLSRAFVRAGVALTPNAGLLNGSWGLYMRTTGQTERYRLLSVPWTGLEPDSNATFAIARFEFEAATPDSRHVVFNSTRQLLPHAPSDEESRANALYEWVDGSIRLVSVPPPGLSIVETGIGQPVIAGSGGQRLSAGGLHGDHVISDDGQRVFFTAHVQGSDGTDLGPQLMVREGGVQTRVVSASERPGDPAVVPTSDPTFWAAASDDGSVAFFVAGAPLTDGAGSESLYRWDANAPEGPRLTELSVDPLGDPQVLGPAAVSDDASSVYFVAAGVLAEGATRDQPNLYLWREGVGVRFIATLDGGPGGVASSRDYMMWLMQWSQGGRAARVSADGERLLFASFAQLDPSYDTIESSPGACGDPEVAGERCRQIYLYDARSERISCLSCVAGAAITDNANLFGHGETTRPGKPAINAPLRLPRNLSADGERAFFETARRLVPEDSNDALDVYEWVDDDLDGRGELYLISPGRGTTDSQFLDASVTGDDVFFTTREQLVGIDSDHQVDLYDARVGGGLAAQNPPRPAPCTGEECQGVPTVPPVLAGVGSGSATDGNVRPRPRPSFSVRTLSRRQLARLARGRRVAVVVRVNRAGRVSLTARSKVSGRLRRVARASRTARSAGLVRLGLRLSASARRQLSRDRVLRVRLVARFAGVREAKTSTLRLRRPAAGRRGR